MRNGPAAVAVHSVKARLLSSLTLLLLLCACATKPSWEVVKPELERTSSEEQELVVIRQEETSFLLRSDELLLPWQRANLFATQYLGVTPRLAFSSRKNAPDREGLEFASENYAWMVSKQRRGKAILVSIECTPSTKDADAKKAQLNAQNLARFMREGRLQLALLAR